jgi:hypothetical protein
VSNTEFEGGDDGHGRGEGIFWSNKLIVCRFHILTFVETTRGLLLHGSLCRHGTAAVRLAVPVRVLHFIYRHYVL